MISRSASIILILFLAISGFLIPYVSYFIYAIDDYNAKAYTLAPPDSSTFIPVNSSRLYAMAMWYENNIAKYHMPNNLIMSTYFNDSSSVGVPLSYAVDYDSAEWSGHYLLAEACRYQVHLAEGNLVLANQALANITRVLNGFDCIIHVAPNGGMARYAWPISNYTGGYDTNRYLGYWNGQYYIYEDGTSRDMFNGVIMGLGFTYLLVNDTTTRATVSRLVQDILNYLLARGWLYIDPEGDPNGTDLDAGYWIFGTAGLWTLAYLKVGELVNETRFGPLYREYAIDRDYIHRVNFVPTARINLVQSYFGLLLNWEVMFILTMAETDTALRAVYLRNIDEFNAMTMYDRNAIFNTMWLVVHGYSSANPSTGATVIADVEDCLMRYYNSPTRLPGRNYPYSSGTNANPTSVKWAGFFTNGTGKVLYPFWKSIFDFAVIADKPLTPDKRPGNEFLWSTSPYNWNEPGDGHFEESSVDYTVVYWMCRYFGIISTPDNFAATILVKYGGT